MANLILCDEMLAELLDEQTGVSSGHAWDGAIVRVFQNNITPDRSKVKSDFTVATFAGYADITLAHANFPAASVSGHVASTTYSTTLTWTRSTTGSSQTVYGIYVVNAADTKVIAAALFDAGPYTVTNSGDSFSETLTLRRSSEFS